MTGGELLVQLEQRRDLIRGFRVCVSRAHFDWRRRRNAPVRRIEFDHDDGEIKLVANILRRGRKVLDPPLTVDGVLAALAEPHLSVKTYTVFSSSQRFGLNGQYEGVICTPIRSMEVRQAAAVVRLVEA